MHARAQSSSPSVLLVETSGCDVVAVRFPHASAARAWEDEHWERITTVGCPKLVTAREALRLAEATSATEVFR